MIANEEVAKLDSNNRERRRKTFDQGKGKGYKPHTKEERHMVLKLNDIKIRAAIKSRL